MKRILGLVGVNLLLITFLSISTKYFLTVDNIIVLIDNISLEIIALSGYSLLLIAGHFDLSVDGVAAISGVTAGLLMTHGVGWVLAVLISLTLALALGVLNGIIVVKMGINGLIATLTTWWICVGFSLGLTKALSPYGFPEAFQLLGQSRIYGFRSTVVIAIIVAITLSLILHRTRMGAHIYASGDNKVASEMMGINTTKLGIKLYILVGLLSGFIGLIIASRLNASSPVAVDGMALRVIAAVVIGGGSLSGGKGTIIGGILGLFIMHILSNAIIQLGINPYYQKAMMGGILLAAVVAEKTNIRLRRTNNV